MKINHIQNWADGEATSIEKSASISAFHHSFVHDAGYRIERINDQQNGPKEQFLRQKATGQTLKEVKKRLRDSRESFDLVRKLSPTCFHFRVVDQKGQDIRNCQDNQASSEINFHSTHVEYSFRAQLRDNKHCPNPRKWPDVAE